MIARRRKSTVYIMSNQACPCTSIAMIGKVGMPSVSGGYGAVDTFSDNWIDAIRQRGHAKNVPLHGKHFLALYHV